MRIQNLARGVLVACIAASLLASCGGSGYGRNNGVGMYAAPMPTVTFISPAQASTITFGQAINLQWSSTNSTSCSAVMSNSIGGTFSGSQITNGMAMVAPTGAGNVTYTLACTGAGGMASATTATVTVNPSILSTLSPDKITTIGSTIDPVEQGGNPYGLVIAPVTAGLITQGDLVVCNFNDGATNTEGLGTTIIGLHPIPGAMPYRIAQSNDLLGCNALAFGSGGVIYAAAYSSNENPAVSPAGVVTNSFAGISFGNPWGEAYTSASGQNPAALYVSNVDGSIDRIVATTSTKIAAGFCGSGEPGAVFAPSGLTYDSSIDTLYIVDTSSNSVVAFANVSSIGAAGIVVSGQCDSVAAPPTPAPMFSGPSASSARVIAHGGAFIAPISAALLADGDLIVGNGDINITSDQMPNLAIEVSPVLPGGFVGQPLQLDTSGTPGALFGIVATVDSQGNQIVYFNDDNANAVMLITK